LNFENTDEHKEKDDQLQEIQVLKKKRKKGDIGQDHSNFLIESHLKNLDSDVLETVAINIDGATPNKSVTGNHPSFAKLLDLLFPHEFWQEVCNQVNDHLQKSYGKSNEKFQRTFYDVKVYHNENNTR
jgi:hypothetical protein